MPSPAITAATAHMAIEQLALADQHYFVNTSAELAARAPQLPPGITFFSGSENSSGKTIGLTLETAYAVKALADRYQAPLFIEADGSKCLPLKAPAEHEPPIPDFVDTVIYVVGLSAWGSRWMSIMCIAPNALRACRDYRSVRLSRQQRSRRC